LRRKYQRLSNARRRVATPCIHSHNKLLTPYQEVPNPVGYDALKERIAIDRLDRRTATRAGTEPPRCVPSFAVRIVLLCYLRPQFERNFVSQAGVLSATASGGA